MPVKSNFSFSISFFFFFYCTYKLSSVFTTSEIVVCELNFRQPKVFRLTMVNPFPHDKILDQTKLKAFADNKLNVTKVIISVFDRVENVVGKGEIACTSNFSFSLNVFKRLLSQTCQKVSVLCGNGLTVRLSRDRTETMNYRIGRNLRKTF